VTTLLFFVFRHNNTTQGNMQNVPPFETVASARLGVNGEMMKLSAADTKGQLGKIFLFSYDDGSIAATLSVENPNIESTSFRIAKGQTRDWLVVTTIESSGTGYMKHIDTWYTANPYFQGGLTVLSYPSDGNITGWTGILNQKLTTNPHINADDKAIDIEFTLETCETESKCIKTTKVAHYVWSREKELFVLDERNSSIDSLQISNLLTTR